MKLAFVGKGGSGKTTMASLFARRAAKLGHPVMAIDADINQHFGRRLGMDLSVLSAIPKLGDHISDIKEYLRGDNPFIPSVDRMIKTTPPGPGSNLLAVGGSNPIFAQLFVEQDGIRFATTGDFKDEDLGKRCYHSKTAAVELILGHLVDDQDEFVVVDMVAGAEIFGSGMFARFDAIVVVVEPTEDSLDVYRQVMEHTSAYGLTVWVVGNKIEEEEEKTFLLEHIDTTQLLGWFEESRYVKAAARGEFKPIDDLEEANVVVLNTIIERAKNTPKDWERFMQLAHTFHSRAVEDWANNAEFDLMAQNVEGFLPELKV
jgi:CO dehydrogenase maturation factor